MRPAIVICLALLGCREKVVPTSAAVADAAERLLGAPVHMTHEVRLLAGTRLEGPAVTVQLVRAEGAPAVEAGLAVVRLLESAPPGSVVVVSVDDGGSFAVFGASFGALARARGLSGFVVDGAVREIPDLRRLGVVTFARGAAAGSAGGHYRVAGTNVPVVSGGVTVWPGDHVVGDEGGVAVVPRERRDDVLAAARALHRDEQALLAGIAEHGSYLRAVEAGRGRR